MRARGGKEEGEMAALFFPRSLFSSGGRPMLRGRVILWVRLGGGRGGLSDKAGLGSGRRRRRRGRKEAAGPPRAARPAALPSARSAQEPNAGLNYYCGH